jgi:hypothetical protein
MEMTPNMYLENANQGIESLTPESIEQHNVDRAAQGLSRRAHLAQATAGITDEDCDTGNFDSRQAGAEQLLQEAISKASRATSPAERARWSAESERIASSLVNHQLKEGNTETVQKVDNGSVREQLQNAGYDIDRALNFAAESDMSDDAIAAWNEELNSKNSSTAKNAALLLDDFSKTPQYFTTTREEFQVVTEDLEQEIVSSYGEEVAHAVMTGSLALANGLTTPQKLHALYSGNPTIAKAVQNLLMAGKLKFPISL